MPGIPTLPVVSPSQTPSVSKTPSVTPSPFSSPSTTPTVTPSITITPTVTPSVTPTVSVSRTPPVTPSVTPTVTPSPDCTTLNIFTQMQQAALQFMQTSIAYYKHNLSETKRNIYGESLEKWFYQPVLLKCTIERNPDTIKDEMFGPDIEKTIKLTIPRVIWENSNFGLITGIDSLPEIGDIFFDRSTERYYEVHNIITNYVPINANIGVGTATCPQAELVTYNLECHHTRISRLNLSPYKVL